MNFDDYYFFPGFTSNLDKELNDNCKDVFCTDGEYYSSLENIELKKQNNFIYNTYDNHKISGLYVKKNFFKERGLNIKMFNDYYFIPYFTFDGNNSDVINSNISNIKSSCDNKFFSLGFNTIGEIKYNIKPFNKWRKIEGKFDYVPGTYIRKYPENLYVNKGIVICVTEKNGYHKLVICLIQVIRYLGCNLNIEIFYGNNELSENTIHLFNSQKGTKCINMNKFINGFNFSGYQIKPFSLLYSSFEEVILLDADSIVFKNIEDLFLDRDYLDNGTLFFLDQQNKKIQKNKTINFIKENIDSNFNINYSKYNYEQCSSLMVFNKRKKWLSLLGICGLNFNYKNTYNYVFGDKDTFWLGCRLFNQQCFFKKRLGILTYPKKMKDLRKNYSEKNGGTKVLGEGDKMFLDDNDEPLHLNQFKMDTKQNDLLHNTSWNFYLWEQIKIYDNGNPKYMIEIDKYIFKIILKYHTFYLRLCNPNLKPPMNLHRYQKPERLEIIKEILYNSKIEDLQRVINSNEDKVEIENNYIDIDKSSEITTNNRNNILDKMVEECIDIYESQEKDINEEEILSNGSYKDEIISIENEEVDTDINIINLNDEKNNNYLNEDKDVYENVNENKNEVINNIKKNTEDKNENKHLVKENEKCIEDFFSAIDSNHNYLKNKLISLENNNNNLKKENNKLNKENEYLHNFNKKISNKIISIDRENKELINREKEKIKLDKVNKQLLKKISYLNTELSLLKNKLSDKKKKSINYEIENDSESENEEEFNGNITDKNLKFFEMTNEIKKQFELNIIDITQIQKDVITHLNSDSVNIPRNWEEILRDITNFRNKKTKETFLKGINSSIKLLISIAKSYTD